MPLDPLLTLTQVLTAAVDAMLAVKGNVHVGRLSTAPWDHPFWRVHCEPDWSFVWLDIYQGAIAISACAEKLVEVPA